MSHFEFVSIALALIFSFAAARILGALPVVLSQGSRYWITTGWIFVLLSSLVVSWWFVWAWRDVVWTPLRFIWALSIPSLMHLRIGVLVSRAPETVRSWREQFYASRVPFFSLGIVNAACGGLSPWAMGSAEVLEFSSVHGVAALAVAIQLIGLISASPSVHAMIVLAQLASNLVLLIVVGDVPSAPAPT